jgi:predicted transcriptional regulator
MAVKTLLLSIQPKYAEKIFGGSKEVELRRTRPKVQEGDSVVVYASSPKKALIGVFEVRKVIQKPLQDLWEEVEEIAGISHNEFCSYYKGLSVGCGIFLDRTQYFPQPIKLERLKEEWNDFKPPQSFRYLKPSEINLLENMTKFSMGEFSKVHQITLNVL